MQVDDVETNVKAVELLTRRRDINRRAAQKSRKRLKDHANRVKKQYYEALSENTKFTYEKKRLERKRDDCSARWQQHEFICPRRLLSVISRTPTADTAVRSHQSLSVDESSSTTGHEALCFTGMCSVAPSSAPSCRQDGGPYGTPLRGLPVDVNDGSLPVDEVRESRVSPPSRQRHLFEDARRLRRTFDDDDDDDIDDVDVVVPRPRDSMFDDVLLGSFPRATTSDSFTAIYPRDRDPSIDLDWADGPTTTATSTSCDYVSLYPIATGSDASLATVLGDAISQASVTGYDFDAGESAENVRGTFYGCGMMMNDHDDDEADAANDYGLISRHAIEETDAVNVGAHDTVEIGIQHSTSVKGPSGNSLSTDSSSMLPTMVFVEDHIPIHVRNMTAYK